jgi:hypothetical protein
VGVCGCRLRALVTVSVGDNDNSLSQLRNTEICCIEVKHSRFIRNALLLVDAGQAVKEKLKAFVLPRVGETLHVL